MLLIQNVSPLMLVLVTLGVANGARNNLYGQPSSWKADRRCEHCLLKRRYICEYGQPCQRGVFRDKLYRTAFINHCFGVNMLNSQEVNNFLHQLQDSDPNWDASLQILLRVINDSGLWTSTYFTTQTPCSLLPQGVKHRATRTIDDRLLLARDHLPTGRAQSKNTDPKDRYYSVQQFRCPINDSIVWRERYRYCESRDKVEGKTGCVCSNNLGVFIKTKICLDDYGYQTKKCRYKPKLINCNCSTTTSLSTTTTTTITRQETTAELVNATAFKLLENISLAYQLSTTETAIPTSNQPNLTPVVIVLCVALCILIALIACYVIRKRFLKPPTEQDWRTLQHGIEPSVQIAPSPLPDAGYLSVGNQPEQRVYQTIESDVAPPVPIRLFSIASSGTITSSGSRSRLFRQTALSLSNEVLRRNTESRRQNDASVRKEGDYATISARIDDRMYDLPPDCMDLESSGGSTVGNIYASPCDAKFTDDENESDIRVNPLYSNNDST